MSSCDSSTHECAHCSVRGADPTCAVCGGPGKLSCGKCRAVSYCGPECQRAAWPAHKSECAAAATRAGGRSASAPGAPRDSSLKVRLRRDITSAVMLLGSRKALEQAAGACALDDIAGAVVASDDPAARSTFRAAMLSSGGIPALVRILGPRHSEEAQSATAYVLYVLSATADDNTALLDAGAVPRLIALLIKPPSDDVTQQVLATLSNFCGDHKTAVAIAIAEGGGAIPALTRLLAQQPHPRGAIRMLAARTLGRLVRTDVIATAIREAGAIPPLISLLSAPPGSGELEEALNALLNLAQDGASATAIVSASGAIPQLLSLLTSGSIHVQACAMDVLWRSCRNAEESANCADKIAAAIPIISKLLASPATGVQRNAAGLISALIMQCNSTEVATATAGGALPHLVALLRSPSIEVVQVVLGALLELNARDDLPDVSLAMVAAGAVPLLATLIDSPSYHIQMQAMRTLVGLDENDAVAGVVAKFVPRWVAQLMSTSTDSAVLGQALCMISLASEYASSQGACVIAEAGGVLPLCALITSPDEYLQSVAANALRKLLVRDEIAAVVAAAGAIPAFIALLKSASTATQVAAADALSELSRALEFGAVAIVEAGGATPLCDLLASSSAAVQSHAVRCLSNMIGILTLSEDIAAALCAAGAVPRLLNEIVHKSPWAHLACQAMSVIFTMSCLQRGRQAIVDAGAIPLLIPLLGSKDGDMPTYSVSALLNMSAHSAAALHAIAAAAADSHPAFGALLASTRVEIQVPAMRLLLALSECEECTAGLAAAGVIPRLVDLLRSQILPLRADATATLSNLSCDEASERLITSSGGIAPLCALLSSASVSVQEDAASTLRNLVKCASGAAAVAAADAIPQLVRMLRAHNVGVQVEAIGTLHHMSKHEGPALVAAGAIPAMVQMLRSPFLDAHLLAVATLSDLSANPDNSAAIASAEGVQLLTKLLTSASVHVREHAATTLRNMQAAASAPLESLKKHGDCAA